MEVDRRRGPRPARQGARRCCADEGKSWSKASTACTSTSAAARRTRRAAGCRRKCRSTSPTCMLVVPNMRQADPRRAYGSPRTASEERYCKTSGRSRHRQLHRQPQEMTSASRTIDVEQRHTDSKQWPRKRKKPPPKPPLPSGPPPTPRLQERYQKEDAARHWPKKLGRTNPLSLPRLQKIVVNMGVGSAISRKEAHRRRRRGA